MDDLLTRMFLGGFVRMHILYHATREDVFGVEMMEELRRHGYDIGPGTLYPMLQKLERAGFLTCHAVVVGGRRRKYYRATAEGGAALDLARAKLGELVKEVLHDAPPTPSIQPEFRDEGSRD